MNRSQAMKALTDFFSPDYIQYLDLEYNEVTKRPSIIAKKSHGDVEFWDNPNPMAAISYT